MNDRNNVSSLFKKIKKITALQSIPEEITLGFINSKGKLRLSKDGKLKIAK